MYIMTYYTGAVKPSVHFKILLYLHNLPSIEFFCVSVCKVHQLDRWHTDDETVWADHRATEENGKCVGVPGHRIKHQRKGEVQFSFLDLKI